MRRGEIYYISRDAGQPEVGSEQQTGRPAIVVGVRYNIVTVVYLTTQPKSDLPTHVEIDATGRKSTALCEQIYTVDRSRVGDCYGICSDDDMRRIDNALLLACGIDLEHRDDQRIARLEAERDVLKELLMEFTARR